MKLQAVTIAVLTMCQVAALAGDPAAWTLKQQFGTNTFRHPYWIGSLQFPSDGKRIVSAGGRSVCIWDTTTGRKLKEFKGNEVSLKGAALSPDGKVIAAFGGWNGIDGAVHCLDAETGKEIHTLKGHEAEAHIAYFSWDGKHIITGGAVDHTVKVWDAATGELSQEISGKENINFRVVAPGDTRFRAVVQRSGRIDAEPEGVRPAGLTAKERVKVGVVDRLEFVDKARRDMAVSPDGRIAAIRADKPDADKIYSVTVWDTTTGKTIAACKGHTEWITCLRFSPDSTKLVSAGHDGLFLWDAAKGDLVRRFGPTNEYATTIDFSPDGKVVAYGGNSGAIRMHYVDTGKPVEKTYSAPTAINTLLLSGDGKTLFAGTMDGIILCLDAKTGRVKQKLARHRKPVRSLVLSPEGKRLLSVCRQHAPAMCCWDPVSGKLLREFGLGDKGTMCAVFSLDSKQIISSHYGVGRGPCLCIWLAETGELLKKIEHPEWTQSDQLIPCAVPDIIYAGHHNTMARPYDLKNSKWIVAERQGPYFTATVASTDFTFALALRSAIRDAGGSYLDLYRLAPTAKLPDAELAKWAQQLGAPDFEKREAAAKFLIDAGWEAARHVAPLRESGDPEIRTRARKILEWIGPRSLMPKHVGWLQLKCFITRTMKLDPAAGAWAAIRCTHPGNVPNGIVIGSFDAAAGKLRVVKQFDTNEAPRSLLLLPAGNGLLVGNRDGTISVYASR